MEVFTAISRNGTRIIAGSALLGIAFPDAAHALRPYIGDCVAVMLTVSLLRVDISAFAARMRRPLRPVLAVFFLTLLVPLSLLSGAVLLGASLTDPVLLTVLFLFSTPPPVVSAPAFAMLMGIDGAMVLAVTLIASLAVPFSAPWIAGLFVADTMPIGMFDLALALAGIVGAAVVASIVLRRVIGPRRITAGKPIIDTITVSVAILFAVGTMDGITEDLLTRPLFTLGAVAATFAYMSAQMGLTYVVFRPFIGTDAVAVAYAAGSRNAGLLVAGLGATAVSDTTWLFFTLSQLPVFVFPLVLAPLGRKLSAGPAEAVALTSHSRSP